MDRQNVVHVQAREDAHRTPYARDEVVSTVDTTILTAQSLQVFLVGRGSRSRTSLELRPANHLGVFPGVPPRPSADRQTVPPVPRLVVVEDELPPSQVEVPLPNAYFFWISKGLQAIPVPDMPLLFVRGEALFPLLGVLLQIPSHVLLILGGVPALPDTLPTLGSATVARCLALRKRRQRLLLPTPGTRLLDRVTHTCSRPTSAVTRGSVGGRARPRGRTPGPLARVPCGRSASS